MSHSGARPFPAALGRDVVLRLCDECGSGMLFDGDIASVHRASYYRPRCDVSPTEISTNVLCTAIFSSSPLAHPSYSLLNPRPGASNRPCARGRTPHRPHFVPAATPPIYPHPADNPVDAQNTPVLMISTYAVIQTSLLTSPRFCFFLHPRYVCSRSQRALPFPMFPSFPVHT